MTSQQPVSGPAAQRGAAGPGQPDGAEATAKPPVVFPIKDKAAQHQIRLHFVRHSIGVTCTCRLRYRAGPRAYFKIAPLIPADEAIALYQGHLQEVNAC